MGRRVTGRFQTGSSTQWGRTHAPAAQVRGPAPAARVAASPPAHTGHFYGESSDTADSAVVHTLARGVMLLLPLLPHTARTGMWALPIPLWASHCDAKARRPQEEQHHLEHPWCPKRHLITQGRLQPVFWDGKLLLNCCCIVQMQWEFYRGHNIF